MLRFVNYIYVSRAIAELTFTYGGGCGDGVEVVFARFTPGEGGGNTVIKREKLNSESAGVEQVRNITALFLDEVVLNAQRLGCAAKSPLLLHTFSQLILVCSYAREQLCDSLVKKSIAKIFFSCLLL